VVQVGATVVQVGATVVQVGATVVQVGVTVCGLVGGVGKREVPSMAVAQNMKSKR
jgi:hypothetical protein